MIEQEDGKLVFRYDCEEVWIEAWGESAFRIRATKEKEMPSEDWALLKKPAQKADIILTESGGTVVNGKIWAAVSKMGKISIFNQKDEPLVEEYWRNRRDVLDPKCSAIEVEGREFKPIIGGDYHLTMRLESISMQERLYGMGQYQHKYLNLKGLDLELAHRNSQASVPFVISSLGYGLLWNNPGIGRVIFGNNIMSYEAYSTKMLDYWIIAGDTPAEIEEAYAKATGTVPMMPEYGLGFWQCKLRYQTQEELLDIAREYKKRNLPLDLIVADFFHWPKQGEWKFDSTYWPDPAAMVAELKEMSVELMPSIWPTVDKTSENYEEMLEKGYLIRTERGVRVGLDFQGATIHFDATNPGAREYIWNKAKQNYYKHGIRVFWLDEAEPEYTAYDFDNYRYYLGSDLQIGNVYPAYYARAFYEGMAAEGQKNIVNLLRCAWAGSQKYGALVWTGDIASSFDSFRNQLSCGLSMGMAGIPWFTTDIGGFHGGNTEDEAFRELFARWFEWGAFCPVMRLHGDREPRQPQFGTSGGATCCSGAPNEVWSFGPKVYEICKKYLSIREEMRGYLRGIMEQAHTKGSPVMRTLFYEFPDDEMSWLIEDQYMYGDKYLVAPVFHAGQTVRKVYLPGGAKWKNMESSEVFGGGTFVETPCPLETMPVFIRQG